MNPYELRSSEPREPVSHTRLRSIRTQLQGMCNQLDDDERVYVNGLTFTADEFRFMLSCLVPPKK